MSEPGFGGIQRIYGRSTSMNVRHFLRMKVGGLKDKAFFYAVVVCFHQQPEIRK
jgi:hypothetical protein